VWREALDQQKNRDVTGFAPTGPRALCSVNRVNSVVRPEVLAARSVDMKNFLESLLLLSASRCAAPDRQKVRPLLDQTHKRGHHYQWD
jgi:hypothetical protein